MPRVVAFGDNVVDCYVDRGEMFPGGNALNVSVFARRFGAETSYVGAVGDDPAGRHIRSALAQESVDLSRLRILEGRTAYCVIGTVGGEREFLCADLGVSIVAPEEGDLAHAATHDAVHTGRSSHADAHLERLASATRLSFDFAVVGDPGRIARIAPHCYLASFSAGGRPPEEARDLQRLALRSGAEWALVTRGREGAALAGRGVLVEAPAARVEVVDTLGAGDTFIARTLVGLLADEDPCEILKAAAVEAGRTCTWLGGFGRPAPIAIDESHARTIGEIYAEPPVPSGVLNA